MAWVRLDDQFTDHPKLATVGPIAGWVYVSGLCYAARYLTDGFVPETIALRFAGSSPELLEKLVECSLWDKVNGGYQIHDFLDYNPPASKVKAEREAAKARMKGNRQEKSSGSSEVQQKFTRTSGEVHIPPSPSPDDDIAAQRRKAIEAIQQFGLFNASMLAQFDDMWPELVQERRLCWIDDAVRVARAKNASTPQYALKVLANAIHTGKAPGYVNGESHDADTRPRVPAPSKEDQAAADARQAEYERQIAEQLARAGKL